jgi:hypothetical protein
VPRSKRFVPDWPAVLTTGMLSITVAVIHMLDQGGITKYAGSPWWLGWGYRAVEIGGVVIALALLVRRRWMLTWLAALFVGFGPFTGFLLTRLVGLPGDPGDFGNWGDPLGTASLFIEGTLMLTAAAVLLQFQGSVRHALPDPATSTGRPADTGGGVSQWLREGSTA